MKIADAVAKRILAIMRGLTQSTVQSIIGGKSKNSKLLTVVRICDCLNIKLENFFCRQTIS